MRALIYTAGIGEGHDLPARLLAAELRARGAEAIEADWLQVVGRPLDRVIVDGSPFHSEWGLKAYDLEWAVFAGWRPTRAFTQAVLAVIGARRTRAHVASVRPDVVVSTYPASSEVLGRLRRMGRMPVPAVAAITDLAALPYWAARGVDLHLITHPESAAEVRAIAPGSRIAAVTGLYKDEFLAPLEPAEARAQLGLPAEGRLVVVSGGGWAVGDLAGAVAEARAAGARVVALCGRATDVAAALRARFGHDEHVRVEGFTEDMGAYLAAADALVHSTAGLTVLEAIIRGCPVISYGWGRAHIRVNNRAFVRFGLAEVAPDRPALAAALAGVLARPRPAPDRSFARLPSAADEVLRLVDEERAGRALPAA